MSRRALLAKVHVGRKQLGLDDDGYRAALQRVAACDSAANCSDQQLVALLAEFQRLGWTPAPKRPSSSKPYVRKIWAIWADLKPLLDNAGPETLRAFVRRQTRSAKNPDGVGDPEWLSPQDATSVIRGLEGWLQREREQREKAHA